MKKIGIIVLTVILVGSLCACGRRDNENPTTESATTTPTTVPATTAPATTAPTVIPDIPEVETNIPDPTVNNNSTEDATGSTGATQENAQSGSGNQGN